MSFVAHEMVGSCEMEMEDPMKALRQFEAAFRWKQMQVEREPSDARYARDWGWIHSLLGTTQIALGRFDEGITNLQESVHIAEGVLARDPLNGSAQSALFGRLRALAQGLIKIARAPEQHSHPLPTRIGVLAARVSIDANRVGMFVVPER